MRPDHAGVPALSVDDLRRIHNLIADYIHAVDEPDPVLFATLWAPDAEYHLIRDVAGLGAPLRGRDEIIRAFTDYWERTGAWQRAPGAFGRHMCTNLRVGVEDGAVTTRTAMLLVRQTLVDGAVNMAVTRTGVYTDRLIEADGEWVFANRTLHYDPPHRLGVALPVDLYGRVVGD